MEVGVGIENIFKVLRIDNIWRISYLDHPAFQKLPYWEPYPFHSDFGRSAGLSIFAA